MHISLAVTVDDVTKWRQIINLFHYFGKSTFVEKINNAIYCALCYNKKLIETCTKWQDTKVLIFMNVYGRHIVLSTDVPLYAWYSTHVEKPRNDKHEEEGTPIQERWQTFEFKIPSKV